MHFSMGFWGPRANIVINDKYDTSQGFADLVILGPKQLAV